MSAPTIASYSTYQLNTALTSTSIPYPSGIQAGDLIVALVAGWWTGTTLNLPDSGWTVLDWFGSGNGNNHGGIVGYKIADGTESGNTFTRTSSVSVWTGAVILVIRGSDGVPLISTRQDCSSADSNPNSPNFNPGLGARDFLFVGFGVWNTGRAVLGYPSNMTTGPQLTSAGGLTGSPMASCDTEATTATSSFDPNPWTLTALAGWLTWTLAFQAAAPEDRYVDATSGSDSNDGKSSAAPWQTLNKVETEAVAAGTRVFFKRGETWRQAATEAAFQMPSSGDATNGDVQYGAYGSGDPPKILASVDGTDPANWTSLGSNLYRSPALYYSAATLPDFLGLYTADTPFASDSTGVQRVTALQIGADRDFGGTWSNISGNIWQYSVAWNASDDWTPNYLILDTTFYTEDAGLSADGDWTIDGSGNIQVYSSGGNPDTAYSSVVLARLQFNGDNAVYHNGANRYHAIYDNSVGGPAGAYAYLEVPDNAIGVDANAQDYISFDEYDVRHAIRGLVLDSGATNWSLANFDATQNLRNGADLGAAVTWATGTLDGNGVLTQNSPATQGARGYGIYVTGAGDVTLSDASILYAQTAAVYALTTYTGQLTLSGVTIGESLYHAIDFNGGDLVVDTDSLIEVTDDASNLHAVYLAGNAASFSAANSIFRSLGAGDASLLNLSADSCATDLTRCKIDNQIGNEQAIECSAVSGATLDLTACLILQHGGEAALDVTGGATAITSVHSTFYKAASVGGQGVIELHNSGDSFDSTNDIIASEDQTLVYFEVDPASSTLDHDLFYKLSAPATNTWVYVNGTYYDEPAIDSGITDGDVTISNAKTVDPGFIDIATGDAQISSVSGAASGGATGTGVTTDIAGSAYDTMDPEIGAYSQILLFLGTAHQTLPKLQQSMVGTADVSPDGIANQFLPHPQGISLAFGAVLQGFPVVEDQSGGSQQTRSTAHQIVLPSPVVSGWGILILFAHRVAESITDPDGSGRYTHLGFVTDPGANLGFNVYYKVADGDDALTIQTSASRSAHNVWLISNFEDPPEISTGLGLASGQGMDAPNFAPSWQQTNVLWIAACANIKGRTYSGAPSSYTDLQSQASSPTNITSNQQVAVGSASRKLNAASEDPGAFTLTPDDLVDGAAFTIAFQTSGVVAGSGAITLPKLAQALTGATDIQGTSDVELPALTQQLQGSMDPEATADQILPSLTQQALSISLIEGTFVQVLPPLQQLANGLEAIFTIGSIDQILPSLTQQATGAVDISGADADQVLPRLTQNAVAIVGINAAATFAQTLPFLLVHAEMFHGDKGTTKPKMGGQSWREFVEQLDGPGRTEDSLYPYVYEFQGNRRFRDSGPKGGPYET